MNASQLTMIKEAKRLLEDCSCFRGPTGPPGSNGSTIVGPIGPTDKQIFIYLHQVQILR